MHLEWRILITMWDIEMYGYTQCSIMDFFFFLYFCLNIGHIIIILRYSVDAWDFRTASIKWGHVIGFLLYCFLNWLFFNTISAILVDFHNIFINLYSAQIFLIWYNKKSVCEKDHLPLIICLFFGLVCICTGDSAVEESALLPRTLRFYFSSSL